MVIYDSSKAPTGDGIGTSSADQSKSVLAASVNDIMDASGDLAATHESIRSGRKVDGTGDVTVEEQSATDTEMEDVIKTSALDHKSKKIIHRGFKDLESKIDEKFAAEPEQQKPASRGKK